MKQFLPRRLHDIALILVLIVIPIIALSVQAMSIKKTPVATTKVATSSPFDNIQIEGKAAYVYDIENNKIIYQKDAQEPLPLASITKIMTSVVALEEAPADTKVTFTSDDNTGQDGNRIKVGEVWNLGSLINFTLVASSNDGAEAVASAVGSISSKNGESATSTFIDMMNTKAQTLGLTSMHFINPSGLDIDTTQAGAYGSAADVAHLFAYTLLNHPDIFQDTRKSQITVNSNMYAHTAVNTDTAVNMIPGLIGSKTGLTDLAGGNLAIVIDAGIEHPIALVVLGSSETGRFTDMMTLVAKTYAYLALEK